MISGLRPDWLRRFKIFAVIENRDTNHQDLYSGLIRLHILHHACEGDFFGLGMIEELGRHGYKLSSGTMYPLLHSLEKRGFLVSKEKREGKLYRKVYATTPIGRKALVTAKEKVRELFERQHRRSPQSTDLRRK
jgi:DNA-binding PadR family transcriptional regulator